MGRTRIVAHEQLRPREQGLEFTELQRFTHIELRQFAGQAGIAWSQYEDWPQTMGSLDFLGYQTEVLQCPTLCLVSRTGMNHCVPRFVWQWQRT